MKIFISSLFVVFIFMTSFSQDLIFKTTGEEIKAKVIEISPTEIRYKDFENPDGPTYILLRTQVLLIKYQNGKNEIFSNNQPSTSQTDIKVQPPSQIVPKQADQKSKDAFFTNKQNKYFSLATGFGLSYGGIGMRLQSRFGSTVGVGIHAGIGYTTPLITDNGTLGISGGVKFFPYKGIYMGVQFGIIGQFSDYGYGSEGRYFDGYYNEYGISLLGGIDWIFGKHIGINAASGIVYKIELQKLSPGFDLGLVFKF